MQSICEGIRRVAGWTTQDHATTVVCEWTILKYSDQRRSGSKKGQYSSQVFADPIGNRWQLYFFINGNGTANDGRLSLYLGLSRKAVIWITYDDPPSSHIDRTRCGGRERPSVRLVEGSLVHAHPRTW